MNSKYRKYVILLSAKKGYVKSEELILRHVKNLEYLENSKQYVMGGPLKNRLLLVFRS